MFKGPADAEEFSRALAASLPQGVDVIVCPPYVSLQAALDSGLTVYAQNVHWEPEGAFTGDVSPPMLTELGVHGSLVGHSERRQYFGETDLSTARRAQAALAAGLGVLALVGGGPRVGGFGGHQGVVQQRGRGRGGAGGG